MSFDSNPMNAHYPAADSEPCRHLIGEDVTSDSAATQHDDAGHGQRRATNGDAASKRAASIGTPDGQGLYIQQAAQLVGATPVELPAWEQQKLITPSRTASGYRTFTIADIERMQRIQSLMSGGINAEGVRRILEGPAATPRGYPQR